MFRVQKANLWLLARTAYAGAFCMDVLFSRCQSLEVSPQAQTVHAAFVRCAGWVQHAKVWNMRSGWFMLICSDRQKMYEKFEYVWIVMICYDGYIWIHMVTGISAKSPEPGCPGQRSELASENALFSCLVDLGLTGAEMITSLSSS